MPLFIISTSDGTAHEVDVPDGRTVLDACRKAELPMEGLCGGELGCSTCHVVVDPLWLALLDPASEDEEDMLDLLPEVTQSSRLGCQIKASAKLNGIRLTLA
jgi:2Fe-2S ferredoxin